MSRPTSAPPLSLVVPVLDEAPLLPELFSRLEDWRDLAEIIVVDGGSTDGGDQLCAERADVFLRSSPGRALQQNAGAAAASGEYLLFLHCDTELTVRPSEFVYSLQQGPAWGFFPVRLSGRDWRFRVIERFMSWRSALTHVATGDQAVFVSRALFQRLGGFAQLPLMEDVELSKRLRRQASPLLLPAPVVTSSRRWERRGVVRTVLLMWSLRLRYWLGANPADLARHYRGGD